MTVIKTEGQPRQRKAWAVLGITALVLLGVAALLWPYRALLTPPPDPHSPQGRQALRRIADTGRPLIAALARYHRVRGRYPDSLGALPVSPRPVGRYRWKEWGYRSNAPWGDGYRLTRGLGWDPFLYYNGRPNGHGTWGFEPGNGSPRTVFDWGQ